MAASLAAAALEGCTQTVVSPVSVARFVGTQPARLGQGTIAVRAAPGEAGGTLEFSHCATISCPATERDPKGRTSR